MLVEFQEKVEVNTCVQSHMLKTVCIKFREIIYIQKINCHVTVNITCQILHWPLVSNSAKSNYKI